MDFASNQRILVPFHEHPLIPFTRFDLARCQVCSFLSDDGNVDSHQIQPDGLKELKSNPDSYIYIYGGYRCNELGCEKYVIHKECAKRDHSRYQQRPYLGTNLPEPYHISHPQHKLHPRDEVPHNADKYCLLCGEDFDQQYHQLHYCDVCNFSVCKACMINPPPVDVESPTTHEHQLHLVPRLIKFTCNACGELGYRSPYFCLECNFMIHRECIDLPRVININRHDHRISYVRRLGHRDRKCRVCRKKVKGFYGAYICGKCPTFAVHSLCAIRIDVWDMRELEGMPEEEEIPPYEVIDDNTIKHFSHDHNLKINRNGHGRILPENMVCEACILQILSEPFYSCEQCNFILHEKCANHPRKKRHVRDNLQFTLHTDTRHEIDMCSLCYELFTGFRYKNPNNVILDVRCAAISDTLEHGSHQHPLYYLFSFLRDHHLIYSCSRSQCQHKGGCFFKCDKDECKYMLDGKCALFFPKEIMKIRYDDHPLLLYFGDKDHVDGEYWCEACETKVNPKEWFYTCYGCNTILHIFCVVGDFSYMMPGSIFTSMKEVVSNNSVCRPVCFVCNSRCKLSLVLKLSNGRVDVYICSVKCFDKLVKK